MGIYDYEKKFQQARKLVEDSKLSIENKKYIFDFIDDLSLEGFSKPRLIKYLINIRF